MKLTRKRVCSNGLTRLEVVVVIAVVTVLIGLVCLMRLPPRHGPSKISCINNLKHVGLAFRTFAEDHAGLFPAAVSTNNGGVKELAQSDDLAFFTFQVMSFELTTPRLLLCPLDKERSFATNWVHFQSTNFSYFVGLDSLDIYPQSFLSGDPDLTVNGNPVTKGHWALTTNMTVGWAGTLHGNAGNVLFGDGRVDRLMNSMLQQQIALTGFETNRVVIP